MNSGNYLNTSHQTLAWFAEQDEQGILDLRPGFQRRPVWTSEEQSFLIDSVIRGYPVPEIYVQSQDDGITRRIGVVDGQQRLRACLEYLADSYEIRFDPLKLGSVHSLDDTPWYGKRFSELDEVHKRRIRRYKMIVRDLEEASDEEVRHLFHRLNQSNVALNAQELRFSIYQGGLLEFVENMVENPVWDHIRLFTKFQRRRMLDSEYVSELVVGHLHFPQNKKDDLDEYYRRYAQVLPGKDQIESEFNAALNAIRQSFKLPLMDRTRWSKKSDFYTLFLLLTRGKIRIDEDGSIDSHYGKLVEFSDLVSGAPSVNEPRSVSIYRAAVERAASDRGRRNRRDAALAAFLEGNRDPDIDMSLETEYLIDDDDDAYLDVEVK